MSNSVDIVWTSKDEEVLRTFRAVQDGMGKIDSRMNRLEQSSRRTAKATRDIGGSAGSAVAQVAKLAGAYGMVTAAINFAKDANRAYLKETQEAGKKSDQAFREFGILTGLRGAEFEAARSRIRKHAEAVPLSDDPTGFAANMAKQLASSGFSNQDASGGALRNFLEVLAASGVQDQGEELVLAMSQYMSARGMEKNAANVNLVGREFQRMSLTSDTGIADLNALAKETGSISQQLTPQEEFAAFQQLRAGLGPEQAATQLRNITSRLATASAFNVKREALADLGLKPEDVDFVGEDALVVLERLEKGIQSVREEARAPIMAKLFETQGVAAANILIKNREKIREEMKLAGDDSEFAETLAFSLSGRTVAERRQQVRRETRRSSADELDDLLIGSINEVLEEMGHGPVDIAAQGVIRDHMRAFGFSRDAALRQFLPLLPDRDVLGEAKLKLADDAGYDPELLRKLYSPEELQVARRRFRLMELPENATLRDANRLRERAGLSPLTEEELERNRRTNAPPNPDLDNRLLRGLSDAPPDGQRSGNPSGNETAAMERQNDILARIERNTRPSTHGPVKAHRNKPPSSRLSRGGGGGSVIS